MGLIRTLHRDRSADAGILMALTTAGFVLRLAGIDHSMYGDEATLHAIVDGRGLGEALDVVESTEKTPPLHFILAWGASQLGDPTIWTRLPSLVLGTAAIPLVYLLGLRTVGRSAGLVAAALMALAPFAIFYGIENRAYGTLTFFSVGSTLTLLTALRRDRAVWWVAYGASAAAVLYTHYTGVFVVLAQFGWALWTHRARVRQLLLVHAAVALAFLPWLGGFLTQLDHSSTETTRLAKRFPLSADTVADMFGHVLPGYPFVSLSELPGALWVGVVWATIGTALAVMLVAAWTRRRSERIREPAGTRALIVLLALVTPAGLILYSTQPDTSVLLPRNLSASLPALFVLVAALVTSLRPALAATAVGLMAIAVGVGAAKTLDDDYQPPPYRQVAQFIDRVGGPHDAVVAPVAYYLNIHFDRKHTVIPSTEASAPGVWRRARHGGEVFVVRPLLGLSIGLPPLAGPSGRVPLRSQRVFAGDSPIAVGRYAGEVHGELVRRNAHEVITWSLEDNVAVTTGAARGFVDSVSLSKGVLRIDSWALDGSGREGADSTLAFLDRRLLAIGWRRGLRPDIAKVYGTKALVSGFAVTAHTRLRKVPGPSRLRVFAVVGDRASELELTQAAKKAMSSR